MLVDQTFIMSHEPIGGDDRRSQAADQHATLVGWHHTEQGVDVGRVVGAQPGTFAQLGANIAHADPGELDEALTADADALKGFELVKRSQFLMTAAIKGKTRGDAETLIQEFLAMATGKRDLDGLPHIGRLAVFAGVRDLPTRVKCAILPWHTLHAAFNSVASTSTEAEEDPMHVPIGNA